MGTPTGQVASHRRGVVAHLTPLQVRAARPATRRVPGSPVQVLAPRGPSAASAVATRMGASLCHEPQLAPPLVEPKTEDQCTKKVKSYLGA